MTCPGGNHQLKLSLLISFKRFFCFRKFVVFNNYRPSIYAYVLQICTGTSINTRIHTYIHTFKDTCMPTMYSVHLSNARVNQYYQSFIPFSGRLMNSLPASIFQLPMTSTPSRGRFQDTYPCEFGYSLSLFGDRQLSGPFCRLLSYIKRIYRWSSIYDDSHNDTSS